jgi:hypothetical protein
LPFKPRLVITLLGAIACGASHLQAEEPRLGVQVIGSIPSGGLKDVTDGHAGWGVGAHMTFDLGGAHLLRPRLDGVFYPSAGEHGATQKATDLSLGSDYLFFLGGKQEGLYLMGGLAVHRWEFKASTQPVGGYPGYSGATNSTQFGYSLGVGCDFTRALGAEVRYVDSRFTTLDHQAHTARSFQAGLTYRF